MALAAALSKQATVFRPEPNRGSVDDRKMTEQAETQFRETGLKLEIVTAWETRSIGPFRLFAAPSVDGFGDPQRCWIVEAGGQRILHAGDTLFHGYWWAIKRAVGPLDAAFLPMNRPTIDIPLAQPPSTLPAVMTPEEAAIAAHVLEARTCVPIHYGLQHPPEYSETPHALSRLLEKAKSLDVAVQIPARGEWFSAA